jgi:hypothetical protein
MEKEKTLCKYWQKGSCNYGTKCFNLHVGQPGTTGNANNGKNFNDNKNLNNNNLNNNNTGVSNQTNNNNHGNNNGYNKSAISNNNIDNKPPHRNNKYSNNNNMQNNTNQNNSGGPVKNKICQYFTKPGGCDRKDACFFVHNYHESLHHVKRDVIHNTPIVGCCVICKFLIMKIFIYFFKFFD